MTDKKADVVEILDAFADRLVRLDVGKSGCFINPKEYKKVIDEVIPHINRHYYDKAVGWLKTSLAFYRKRYIIGSVSDRNIQGILDGIEREFKNLAQAFGEKGGK